MSFKEFVNDNDLTETLSDNFKVYGLTVSDEAADLLSKHFYLNDGDPRAKNGSWWEFQIKAMLTAFNKLPNGSDEEQVEYANELIRKSGGKAKKYLITRKNLISNLYYVKKDLMNAGVNSSFSNLNDFTKEKEKSNKKVKLEQNGKELVKRFSTLTPEELDYAYLVLTNYHTAGIADKTIAMSLYRKLNFKRTII